MIEESKPDDLALERAKAKYAEEREKRLQAPAGRGVTEITGELAMLLDDPYAAPSPRDAINDEVDVLCIGAGFAGLLVGTRLKEAGIEKVRLVDAAGDVGGVWYWNRYPEAKCDVDSLCYMPLLEETGYIPSQRYATAPEIGAHARRIADQFGLYDHAVFHTIVTDIRWDEDIARWHVRTNRGDDMLAKFVAICNGPMSKVKIPDISGIKEFHGKIFHTARWDYSYTGGGPGNPDLDKLADKTVGLVGTGATGLQVVNPLGRSSKKFYLFQRTPSTVGIRANGPIDPAEVRGFGPGWQKSRQENFTRIVSGEPFDVDMVGDGWTDLYAALAASPRYQGLAGDALRREKDRVDFEKMEQIRCRIEGIVRDPATAEKLKPYYNYGCKRAGWHDEYLETFNLPNVELVDTSGLGIERITKDGIVVNGTEYALDCLIFGTGFETETAGRLRIGFDIHGRNGLSITEKWKDGLATLHGITTTGFPNLFFVPGLNAQAVVTLNVVHMSQEYAQHIAYIVKTVRERGADVFDVTPEAEAEWVRTILDRRIDRDEFLAACTPGRNNYEGNVGARPPQNTVFGGGPSEYFGILRQWRDARSLPGLTLTAARQTA